MTAIHQKLNDRLSKIGRILYLRTQETYRAGYRPSFNPSNPSWAIKTDLDEVPRSASWSAF